MTLNVVSSGYIYINKNSSTLEYISSISTIKCHNYIPLFANIKEECLTYGQDE